MTLSLGLVVAIALLAPGIALFAGLWLRPFGRQFHPTPPPPGSVVALVVIGLGALATHALLSLAFAVHRIGVDAWGAAFTLRHGFDPYAILGRTGAGAQGLSGVEVAVLLLWVTLACLAAYGLAGRLRARPIVRRLLFGWLTDLVDHATRDPADKNAIAAFVLTKLGHDGVQLGYRGLVQALSLDSDREIISVVLTDVRRFTLALAADGSTKTVETDGDTLPQLYLPRDQIANAILAPFVFETDAPPPSP